MEPSKLAGIVLAVLGLVLGCATSFEDPPEWIHHDLSRDGDSNGLEPSSTWKLYTDEELLTGRQTHALCGASSAAEAGNARICFRREGNQLVTYVALPQKAVRSARCCVLTQIRVDANPPVSPRSALAHSLGRGFDPRFPGASFPTDDTNPRTGILEPNGLLTQLHEGRSLLANVAVEPEGYVQFAIELKGISPLLAELWEFQR